MASVAKAATVLSCATSTASGVEVSRTSDLAPDSPPPCSLPTSRARTTMCTLDATPSPISSGMTMTLAKLKGRSNSVAAATVHSEASASGASTSTTSETRRRRKAITSAMAMAV